MSCFLCNETRKWNAWLCYVVILGDIKAKEYSALFWWSSELVMFENSYAMCFEIFPYEGSPVDEVWFESVHWSLCSAKHFKVKLSSVYIHWWNKETYWRLEWFRLLSTQIYKFGSFHIRRLVRSSELKAHSSPLWGQTRTRQSLTRAVDPHQPLPSSRGFLCNAVLWCHIRCIAGKFHGELHWLYPEVLWFAMMLFIRICSCLTGNCFVFEGESPAIRLPASSIQHAVPMTLFQTTAASTTSVAVAVPTLPLRPVVSSQPFAEPAQTEAFVSPGLNFSLKRPAPVFAESFSNRNPSNISSTSGRFSVSNSEIPGISVFPRGIALPQATPFIPSPAYVSAPIGQPAGLFGGTPQFPFCHPSFIPGPRCFPSR